MNWIWSKNKIENIFRIAEANGIVMLTTIKNSTREIIIFFVLFQPFFALLSDNYCHVSEMQCNGYLNSQLEYNQACKLVKCQGKFNFQCGHGLCTLDKHKCVSYQNMSNLIESIKKLAMFNTELKGYSSFRKYIPICPSSAYVWNPDDVWRSGWNCVQKNLFKMRSGDVIIDKNIKCHCIGKYSYQCGTNFCSIGKKACEVFLAKSHGSVQFKNCGNDNIVTQKKYKLFY